MNRTVTLSTNAGDCWCNKPSIGTFDSGSGTLQVGGEGTIGDDVQTWIPFIVPIQKNRTIVSATFRVIAIGGSVGDPSIRIGCEAADNPAAPTSLSDLRARVMSSSFTDTTAGSNSVGAVIDYNVTGSVQEILNRAGWSPSNTMAIKFEDLVSGSAQHRQYASFENTTYNEPQLLITYQIFIPGNASLV
jgi:hypothetical protein